MKNSLLAAVMSAGLLFSTAAPAVAVVRPHHRATAQAIRHRRQIRHRRHMKTAKRVGIGAAGGAAAGALVGGVPGAAIGAAAGAGGGALYDWRQKHRGR
jgi:hypothetical protein